MLHSFSCENFYSIKDRQEVSFVVNRNAPDTDTYFTTPSGARLSKLNIVVGANASGKTNILKVLPFMQWFLLSDPPLHKARKQLPVKPFQFCEQVKKESTTSVTFEINEKIYTYSITLTEDHVTEETLKVKTLVAKRHSTKILFTRKWDAKSEQYNLHDYAFNLPKPIKKLSLPTSSLLGASARYEHPESVSIISYWENIHSNIVESGWDEDLFIHSTRNHKKFLRALTIYAENPDIKKEAEQFLGDIDTGLSQIKIDDSEKSLNVEGVHMVQDKDYPLPLLYESSGTKQVMATLAHILYALKKAKGQDTIINILDEIDTNLHPDITEKLSEFFLYPNSETKQMQTIFSTHNHRLLDEVDKYQVIFVQRENDGSSKVYRLDEIEGVRSDENYYEKYIAGRYGATPYIL
ncbi:MAG: ATP-binding protein [Candidatus Spechtbacteria bacterium SB0662_bin_43]|uniref:ATP-binding protein n=1 Tax=Candidatus Spechtbacteria bacterium SB0662_bin_43 TaxID=2604897 RepID=A0A845DAF1_9BACT|nr:ATP-binding protein [Candidatus Spechtbacteria bacterium SB0662_bin_43]